MDKHRRQQREGGYKLTTSQYGQQWIVFGLLAEAKFVRVSDHVVLWRILASALL